MPGHNANRGAKDPPSLVPTSSFNKVLLVGGKNLTLFQSVGLLVLALVALGIGVSLLAVRVFWFAMWGSALTLWGFVMLFNGSKGVVVVLRRNNRSRKIGRQR
jgi:hypothetical protein